MRIPAKIRPPRQMTAPAYIAKVLKVPKGLRSGEVHRSLGMGGGAAGAHEHEGGQRWAHHMSSAEKAFFGKEFSQPSGRLNGPPNEGFILSARTGNSIHFAPPLTSVRQHGAKLRLPCRNVQLLFRSASFHFGMTKGFRQAISVRVD